MSEARLHALHWAFFVDVMNMKFEDVYAMFSAWCESVPADEMADIMALGDELFGDDDTYDSIPLSSTAMEVTQRMFEIWVKNSPS